MMRELLLVRSYNVADAFGSSSIFRAILSSAVELAFSHDEGVQEIALTALKAAPEERVHFALARHWTMLILRAWSFPLASKLYQGIHIRIFAMTFFITTNMYLLVVVVGGMCLSLAH